MSVSFDDDILNVLKSIDESLKLIRRAQAPTEDEQMKDIDVFADSLGDLANAFNEED